MWHKVHYQGTAPVPPKPGTKGWNRVVARGCGGHQYYTMDGPDYRCDHDYGWACDDCPVCITFQRAQQEKWEQEVKLLQGPPRNVNPPLTPELWMLRPEVETELCWLKEP